MILQQSIRLKLVTCHLMLVFVKQRFRFRQPIHNNNTYWGGQGGMGTGRMERKKKKKIMKRRVVNFLKKKIS